MHRRPACDRTQDGAPCPASRMTSRYRRCARKVEVAHTHAQGYDTRIPLLSRPRHSKNRDRASQHEAGSHTNRQETERTRKKKEPGKKKDASTWSVAFWVAVPPYPSRAVRDSDPGAGVLCRRPSRTAWACGCVWHAGRAGYARCTRCTGSTGPVGRAGRSGASRTSRPTGSCRASRRNGTRGSAGAVTAARGL